MAAPAFLGSVAVLLWTLRLLLLLNATLAVAQPVMAGSYLGGNFDIIGAHGLNGSMVLGATFLSGIVAIAYAVLRGPVWPVPVLVLLWFAEAIQLGLGYSRNLAVHIPLGVAIVGIAVALGAWAWTPAARRRRARRTERGAVPA
jgi:hypothetical protein